jgi:UDP-N-acetylmuramoyl-tripeptide--D-alanyl-D-alanine ligase
MMEIGELYRKYKEHPLISTDSRKIIPGSIFFALKGDTFNGNLFVADALARGAVFAVADEKECRQGAGIIRVHNVLHTLQQLALYHRRESHFKLLAITGSNGKTTSKELSKTVLSNKYRVYATQGNLNNHIGVPLTLLAMTSDTELGIVEMGANHPGEIEHLCNIAEPDFGLITNIGKAHLEGFGDINGVARAKGELFAFLHRRGGTIFANNGNPMVRRVIPDNSVHVVGYNSPDTIWAEERTNNLCLLLDIHDGNHVIPVQSQLVGSYNIENILAAYAVGRFFQLPPATIANAIASYAPSNSRSQYIKTLHNEVIMDAYNANPSSMKASIENFLALHRQSAHIILGEMLELGASSETEHQTLIGILKESDVKKVTCVGKNFEKPAMEAGYDWFPDVTSLHTALLSSPIRSSFILIKGSRGNQLEKIMELL